jgi:hypothetical protein
MDNLTKCGHGPEADALLRDLAVAALGPWGRLRYRFGCRFASSQLAYYGDELRWWHRRLTPPQRAWLVLAPALGGSERVYWLAVRFGFLD